jgi:hypothetical protein
MVHGWLLLSAALTAVYSCGAAHVTTSSERRAGTATLANLDARNVVDKETR